MKKFSLMVHGGIGMIADRAFCQEAIRDILQQGRRRLEEGDSALDVVEYCTTLLEDNELFNAGRGSALTTEGHVENDAAIMEGSTMNAGAVAAVSGIKNPIVLARAVMEKSEHVMLAGAGAEKFAQSCGFEIYPREYFVIEYRKKQLETKQAKIAAAAHIDDTTNMGTVGAVAYDRAGNLAAATSTGGRVNKKSGRVGDSPVVGAGVFADNDTCAFSSTGVGEGFLRTALGAYTASLIRHRGMDAPTAAAQAVVYLTERVGGRGGVIVIDAHGNMGSAYTTRRMLHGSVSADTDVELLF